jgi:hypothetical protein
LTERKIASGSYTNKRFSLIMVGTVFTLLFFSSFFSFGSIPNSSVEPSPTALCSSLAVSGDPAGGIFSGPGGAFVEDFYTGAIDYCNGGATGQQVAPGPAGHGGFYFGMGGVKTKSRGLVLALTNYLTPGLWLCYGASASGCASRSKFISLPSMFCRKEPQGNCDPQGTALDSSLNLYYVDALNSKLVECKASSGYQSCSNLPASSALKGHEPDGLYRQGRTFYVSDGSCQGFLWEGTSSSLTQIGQINFQVYSIVASKHNADGSLRIYVAYSAGEDCPSPNTTVVEDWSNGAALVTFGTAYTIPGLDPNLQFSVYSPAAAYQATDSS